MFVAAKGAQKRPRNGPGGLGAFGGRLESSGLPVGSFTVGSEEVNQPILVTVDSGGFC